jgi:(p)ppGpp synthase/HD superfamily hydrolase
MTTIEDIIRIAVKAHDGMKDMVGNPAVAHVLAVGLMGKTVAEQKAGFLHDVVEDSDFTLDDLRAEGVEEDLLTAVDLLTHRPGMSYEEYVKNIVRSRNETAIHVKLNDLHHNLHRAELALMTLDTSTRERQALLDEILSIAAMHDRAERYIQSAIVTGR